MYMYVCVCVCVCVCARARVCVCMHARTHTHTHIHMYNLKFEISKCRLQFLTLRFLLSFMYGMRLPSCSSQSILIAFNI